MTRAPLVRVSWPTAISAAIKIERALSSLNSFSTDVHPVEEATVEEGCGPTNGTPIVSMYAYHQQDTSQVPRGVRFDFHNIAVTQHDIPGLTQMHRKTSVRARDAAAGSQSMR